MQIGSAGAANFFKAKADKSSSRDSRAKKADFADLVGRPSSTPSKEVGSKAPRTAQRQPLERQLEPRRQPARNRDAAELNRKVDGRKPASQQVETISETIGDQPVELTEGAGNRISQAKLPAGLEGIAETPVEVAKGPLMNQTLLGKRSPSLEKLGTMLKPLVKLSPQLNFLSGNHSGIAVDDLPELISSGNLIKFGLQNDQEEQLMTEKKPVHAWLAASGLGGNWEHHAPRADIDLQEEVTGKDFFKALGIDPQRVVVELVRLKQSLAGPGGLTEYVELNKFGKNQGFGLVQPYGETEAKPSVRKDPQGPAPSLMPVDNEPSLNRLPQDQGPSLASRIKKSGSMKADGLPLSRATAEADTPAAPLVPTANQTPAMARSAGIPKVEMPSVESKPGSASANPLKELTHSITDENPMNSVALDKNTSVKIELDTHAGQVSNPLSKASVNSPSLRSIPKSDFALRKDLFTNAATDAERVEIATPKVDTFRVALEKSISNLTSKAPAGVALERGPSIEVMNKAELDLKPLEKEGDRFLGELESLPQENLKEGGAENSFGESGAQGQSFSQANTKFAPLAADSFASSEQGWMESLDGAASSSSKLDSYTNEFTQKVLQKAQVLVNKQQSSLSFDFGTGDNKIQIGLSLNQNALNLKIASNDNGLKDALGGEIEQLQAALSQQNIRLNEVEMGKTMTSEHSHQQGHLDQQSFQDQRPNDFNEQFEEIKSLWENSSSPVGRNTRLPQWPTSAKLAGVVDPTVKGRSSIAVRI